MRVECNGKVHKVDKPKRVIDILKEEISEEIIACKCNNQIRTLDYMVEEDAKIELIDISDQDGMRVYIRGLLYVAGMAFAELYPQALLTINYQLSNSMFCEIENRKITEEMMEKVKQKMQEIVDANKPIRKVVMSKKEAEKFYEKEKTLKGKLQLDTKEKETVCLYYCENYYNYFYGIMPISTGYMKIFDLMRYKNGFLVRYPSKKNIHALAPFKENRKLLKALQDYENIHRLLNVNTLYKLNRKVKEGKAKDVVLLDEALHEKKISDIADEIAKRKKVKVVLIAGPSSSGKTTFAQRLGLQLSLNGMRPVTISVDNYFVEREDTPKNEKGEYDFENIHAIDLELLNSHILKLLDGEEVEMPTFNFHTGRKEYRGDKIKLGKEDVLVMEGIHCLNDILTSQIPKDRKYKIYISALTVLNIDYYNRISTTDSRLIRRIVRDNEFRGYSAMHTIKMWPLVMAGENKNIFPFQEEADSVFNTSLIYELSVLKEEAVNLLKQIDSSEPEYAEAKRLCDLLQYFEPIPKELVPTTSLLREFVGGGDFRE